MQILKYLYSLFVKRVSKVQIIIIIAIIIYAFLISENNLFTRWKYDLEINELNDQIDYYRNRTQEDSRKLKELDADKDEIEKFARENYLMKKPNEDIYIVE